MNTEEIGSLAQSARGKQLNTARWILIIVGLLTAGLNGFMFANAQSMIDTEVK